MVKLYDEVKTKKLNNGKLSPLESVILAEGMSPEDRLQFHNHRCQLLLENTSLGDSPQAAVFHSVLDRAGEYPLSYSQLSRCRKYRCAAEVYSLMLAGLSCDAISEKLGISAETVRDEQRKLFRLYRQIEHQLQGSHQHNAATPFFQTFNTIRCCKYRTFCRTDTGCNSYHFFHQDRLIGTASIQILPDFPLIVQSDGLILSSSFNPENTIFPGVSREIFDVDDPTVPYGRLIRLSADVHRLQLNYSSGTLVFDIKSREKEHFFYRDRKLIASIHPIPLPQRIGDWELRYCLKTNLPIADPEAVIFLCFPLLKFL